MEKPGGHGHGDGVGVSGDDGGRQVTVRVTSAWIRWVSLRAPIVRLFRRRFFLSLNDRQIRHAYFYSFRYTHSFDDQLNN